jgi:hypothetical protein
MTREFLVLLEGRNMEAWVLVAHFAMLPAKVEGILWLEGLATNTITATAIVIGKENWDWIAWPAAAARVDLELMRSLSNISQSLPSEMPVEATAPLVPCTWIYWTSKDNEVTGVYIRVRCNKLTEAQDRLMRYQYYSFPKDRCGCIGAA